MKSYKYSTKERAQRVARTLDCTGYHTHEIDGKKKYMPCKSHKIFLSKVKKEKGEEDEVNELVDFDGTWLTSSIGILDPASTLDGSVTPEKMVQGGRNPRDPLLRGWYGYYGESHMREEDMTKAFGYEKTKDLSNDETIKFFEKKFKDKEKAKDRGAELGRKKGMDKKTPKKIKNKDNFIDRMIIKEKGVDDLSEDKLIHKKEFSNILKKNAKSLKNMADKQGVSLQDLIDLLKDE
jgi:hypothetical protein